jgi:predicted ATPase
MSSVSELRTWLNRQQAEHNHAIRTVERESEALVQAKARIGAVEQAQKILQEVAEAIQQQAHEQIAGVVSACLTTVMDEQAYQLKIKFEQRRGKTEADLLFCRGDLELDPLTAAGGGVVDLASFALRLSCLTLAEPRRRQLLVLDEPFKMLSREYQPVVAELLLQLAKQRKVQIVMVTHNLALAIGKVVEL